MVTKAFGALLLGLAATTIRRLEAELNPDVDSRMVGQVIAMQPTHPAPSYLDLDRLTQFGTQYFGRLDESGDRVRRYTMLGLVTDNGKQLIRLRCGDCHRNMEPDQFVKEIDNQQLYLQPPNDTELAWNPLTACWNTDEFRKVIPIAC